MINNPDVMLVSMPTMTSAVVFLVILGLVAIKKLLF